MSEYSVSPLDDKKSFLGKWRELYARGVEESFFLSPPWVSAWVEGAESDMALRCIEGRCDGELVLLGAYSMTRGRPVGLGLREAWFHEFGAAEHDAIYIEYNDFLISPNAPADARQKAIGAIFNTERAVDAFVYRNVRNEMKEAIITVAAEHSFTVRIMHEQPVYVCALSGDAFPKNLSKSLRTKINRAARLYEERGELVARAARTDEEKQAAWSAMTRLHAAGWEARGGQSVFDNPHLIAFHERLNAMTPETLDLFEVKSGDEVIAVLYNFIHGKRVMNYQSGFLFEDDNRLTPGFVAHMLAAEYYARAGFEIYDLLAGDADYKARLGRAESTLTTLVVERPTWRNRLRNVIKR